VGTDAGARMQIDSGAGVRPFGHDADERNVLEIEFRARAAAPRLLRYTDRQRSLRPGLNAAGSAVERGIGIGAEQFRDARQIAEEPAGERVSGLSAGPFRLAAGPRRIEALADFTFETGQDTMEQGTGDISGFGEWTGLRSKNPGNNKRRRSMAIPATACFEGSSCRRRDGHALAFIRFQQAFGQLDYR